MSTAPTVTLTMPDLATVPVPAGFPRATVIDLRLTPDDSARLCGTLAVDGTTETLEFEAGGVTHHPLIEDVSSPFRDLVETPDLSWVIPDDVPEDGYREYLRRLINRAEEGYQALLATLLPEAGPHLMESLNRDA